VHHGKLFLVLFLSSQRGEPALAIDVFGLQHLNLDKSGRNPRYMLSFVLRADEVRVDREPAVDRAPHAGDADAVADQRHLAVDERERQRLDEQGQVDRAARDVLEGAGFGERILHRTGHNLGRDVHGNGVHMDDYETHDDRRLIPGTGFTVEPGVYFETFGVRTEVNVFRGEREATVTGPRLE